MEKQRFHPKAKKIEKSRWLCEPTKNCFEQLSSQIQISDTHEKSTTMSIEAETEETIEYNREKEKDEEEEDKKYGKEERQEARTHVEYESQKGTKNDGVSCTNLNIDMDRKGIHISPIKSLDNFESTEHPNHTFTVKQENKKIAHVETQTQKRYQGEIYDFDQ